MAGGLHGVLEPEEVGGLFGNFETFIDALFSVANGQADAAFEGKVAA